MSDYPLIPAWTCPIARTLEFQTQVFKGDSSVEQRIMIHAGRQSWSLPYTKLSLADRDALLAAFEGAKGSYSQDLNLTFDGVVYTGCFFDGDELSFVESDPLVFNGTVKIGQVVRAPDAGALPGDFPLLGTGAPTQRPYTHARNFDTVSVRTEGGRFAFDKRPSSLRTWSVGGACLTTAEAQAIWDQFRLAAGQYRAFGYADFDSGVRYPSCRFGSDTLQWQILGPNQNSVQAQIRQLA